ncbi:MAG: hypothetical protein Q9172_002818 [Xanthocarpia lactea]
MDKKKIPSLDHAQSTLPVSASDASTSLASRIGTSTSGLAKEVLFRPDRGTVVNELSFAEAGKNGSSSGSAGPSASSMALQNPAPALPSSSREGFPSLAHQGFRSQPPSEKTQAVLDEFDSFLSLQEQPQSDIDKRGDWLKHVPSLQHLDSDESLPERDTAPPPALAYLRSKANEDPVPNGDPRDGAAVVAMLSDPSFYMDEIADYTAGSEDFGMVNQDYRQPSMDLAQQASIDIAHAGNTLSLIPDFHRPPKEPLAKNSYDDLASTKNRRNQSDYNVNFELQPWIEILTTYHDEVWGDMLPLVEAAREEANAIQNGDAGRREDCPAIRRLAMVAGHMRPNANG